jgi:D-arabinose 1-dehydrogenase-like Zn-dependent alcohol dehydrogenase
VRAAVCHGFGQPLAIEDVELKRPSAYEVSVRVAACGICRSDISFMDGLWDGPLPAVYGHEVAGVVAEVGAGIASVKAGDQEGLFEPAIVVSGGKVPIPAGPGWGVEINPAWLAGAERAVSALPA